MMVNRLEQTQGVLRHKVVKRTVFSVFSNTILNIGFALGYLVAFLWAAVPCVGKFVELWRHDGFPPTCQSHSESGSKLNATCAGVCLCVHSG